MRRVGRANSKRRFGGCAIVAMGDLVKTISSTAPVAFALLLAPAAVAQTSAPATPLPDLDGFSLPSSRPTPRIAPDAQPTTGATAPRPAPTPTPSAPVVAAPATASRRTDRAGYARTASDDCATRDGARPPCAGRYARPGAEADTGRARTTTDARGARTGPNRNLHPAAGSLARACRGQFDTGCYGNAATRRAGQCAVIVVRPRSGGHCSCARGRGGVSVATAEGRTEGFKLGGRQGHRNR